MDYLKDLERFYEDVKKGLEEIGEHLPQSQEEELEAMNKRVKLVRSKCFVLIEKMAEPRVSESLNIRIADLQLSARTNNALIGNNIFTLADLLSRSITEVVGIRSLGRKSLREIQDVMFRHNVTWEMLRPE